MRNGARVGSWMLVATQVVAGALGEAPNERAHVETGADAARVLAVLALVTRDAIDRAPAD